MDFLEKSKEIQASFPSFVKRTSLEFSKKLSHRTGANVWLKREDQQSVRSYKIRGAFARMSQLSEQEKKMELFVPVQEIMRKVSPYVARK